MAYRPYVTPGIDTAELYGADLFRPYQQGLFADLSPYGETWQPYGKPGWTGYGKPGWAGYGKPGWAGYGKPGWGKYGKPGWGKFGKPGPGRFGKQKPYWEPTAGGGFAKQYPPGMAGIPYAWHPGYGLVQ
ncbi:MAG: hypothetical protein ACOY93_05050 [Bacillota bacterium]